MRTISDTEKEEGDVVREQVKERLNSILQPDTVIAIPTAPGIAPLCGQPAEKLESFRFRGLQLTCIGSLGQVPQINLPVGQVDDCPVGLSLMAGRGGDELLLTLAEKLAGIAEAGVAPLRI